MAFQTYADLQTAIGSWLARDDLALYIPDFITLFEKAACRKMRVRLAITTTTLTPSSGVATLPTDFLGWVRATVASDSRVDLEYVHPSYLEALYPTGISDTPSYFTIQGTSFKTRSSDATEIELVYYARTAAVSTTLNWLFTYHPDVYLFGSLAEAGGFTDNLEKLGFWKSRRDEIFDEILKLDFRERGPMQIRVIGATP